jgi:PAS domain S-box-containing protein
MSPQMPVRCISRWRYNACVGLFLAVTALAFDCKGASAGKNILILTSEDTFRPGFLPFIQGLRTAMAEGSTNHLDFFTETLDQSRFPDEQYGERFREYFRGKYTGRRLDLIVAGPTAALDFLIAHRDELFPGVPVVFASADETLVRQRKLPPGFTGLPMRFDLGPTLELALQLQPRTEEVIVIVGKSAYDRSWEGLARDAFKPYEGKVRFRYFCDQPFAAMLDDLSRLPERRVVIYLSFYLDAAGVTRAVLDAAPEIARRAKAPVYSPYEMVTGRGVVGGYVAHAQKDAQRVAELGLRILNGEDAGSIPVQPAAPCFYTVDWRAMQRWGLRKDRLPPGTDVRFREPTLWETHKDYVIGGVCIFAAQSATIAALWLQRNRRRRAEKEARESEEEMALAADAANLGMWVWDMLRDRLWASERCKRIYGYPVDAEVTFELLGARVHPEDKAIRKERIKQAVAASGRYDLQYRLLLPNGTVRWLAVAARVETDAQGKPTRMLGASIDITERRKAEASARELGGRLINAQEDERRRIARDLHDDFNQRLALLSVEMEMLKESGNSTSASSLDRMGAQVKDISSDVHKLAYQLHPAKLDQLGLVAAARSLCRDLTRQAGIEIQFVTEAVPDGIPPQLALCCYRVMQESLGNIVRHSGAKEARVELRTAGSQLLLIVSDEGKGFDVEATRAVSGLGLVSMNERVRLMNGSFEIRSTPGKGTRIELSLPLPPAIVNDTESAKLESEQCA